MARARILFLSANPNSTSRLALDEEVRAIQVRLRQSGAAERIELCAEWALRGDELPAALMRHRPQVVHFSGHGSSAGELILSSGESGDINPITAETLRRIFEPLTGDISCVVLNACYSALQAKALAEILPCVVGMTNAVKDTAAVAFAAGFYEALAFGESVETAFKLGCAQIEIAQASGQRDIPKMLLRPGTDAAQLRPFALAAPAPEVKEVSAPPSTPPPWPRWIWITAGVALSLLAGGAGLWGVLQSKPAPVRQAALRQDLNQAFTIARDPPAPSLCQTRDEEALVLLGRAASLLPRDAKAALALLEKAELQLKESAEYWALLSRARLSAEQPPEESLAAAQRALGLCPNFALAHDLVGNAEQKAKRLEAAGAAYGKALAAAPDYGAPRLNIGLLALQHNDTVGAIAALDDLIHRDPSYPDAFLVRGMAHLSARHTMEALADLEQATRRQPDSVNAWLLLGKVHDRSQHDAEARIAFCRARALGSTEAESRCPAP